MDCAAGRFDGSPYRELDSGFDFYAPQTLATADGRVVMIAWMQAWKRTMPTAAFGWAGSMTLPRELSLEGDRLLQNPVREIEAARRSSVVYRDRAVEGRLTLPGVEGASIELIIEADVSESQRFELRVFAGAGETEEGDDRRGALIAWDRASRRIVFDRGGAGERIFELAAGGKGRPSESRVCRLEPHDGILRLRVFLDVSSVEIFASGGEIAMTGTVYPEAGAIGVEFSSVGPALLRSVEKFDISP
jgi:beta-fructofuranosidase